MVYGINGSLTMVSRLPSELASTLRFLLLVPLLEESAGLQGQLDCPNRQFNRFANRESTLFSMG